MNYRNVLVAVSLAFYCFAFQGQRTLWEPDEGRYTAVAMEMLRLHDWLRPHLHHEQEHWTKPPLTYWAIAASVDLLGRHEFAARLPSALAFLLTIVLVYHLGRLFLERRPWLAALVYATFALPAAASNIITTDSLLTFWETAAVCGFAYAAWGDSRAQAGHYILSMWAAFALAFLTKGPPALLPLLAILVYLRWKPIRDPALRLQWPAGLLMIIAINLLWFGPILVQKPQLAKYFVMEETLARIFTDHHHHHSEWYGAFVVYVPVLLLGTLPWTVTLTRSVIRKARALVQARETPMDRRAAQDRFLLFWLGIPLLVFVLARSRLPLYLLPLFVPMALLTAREFNAASHAWTRRRAAFISAWGILLIASRVIATEIPTKKNAAVLAAAIEAANPAPFTEVAFFANLPLLGLNLYLDKEVEAVSADTLDDELGEEESRLWLVSPAESGILLSATAQLNVELQLLGKVDERYLLFQELPK